MELQRREPGSLYIRVCGANSGGDGPWSNAVSISLATDAPAWIDVQVSESGDRITVTWGAVGRSDYVIEMAADNAAEFTEVYRGDSTSFEMDAPQDADAVRFRVRADLPGAQSPWWTGEAVQIKSGPAVPVLDSPMIDEKSTVRLRWEPVTGAIHYILEASRDESFSNTHSSTPIDDTEILFHAPTSGTYWFRIKAASKMRTSKPSNPVSVNVQRPSPPKLWPIDAVKAHQSFEAAWKGAPGSVYYELQTSADASFPGSATQTNRVFHPAQKLSVPGQPGGRIYLRVRSVDDQNEASLWSDPLAVDVR
jgi:hypothetical protein